MSSAWKLCRAASIALAAAVAAASPARGDTLDLTMPRTVRVGAPRGDAPSERLDPHRTGRARTQLPASPVEIWRRRVNGNIDVPPVIDAADGILVTLTNPEILKLGPDGQENLWQNRARLGNSSALAPPTLLSDGTIAVVTAAGVAWGFAPTTGSVRFSTVLGTRWRDADTAPLALADGGLLVAAGNALVEIDADGVIRARAVLDERATGEHATSAVLDSPGGSLITTASGNVYRFRAPAAPRKVGSFGGTTARGAVLADERTLLAVVDGHRLVALDLPTGTTHVRAGGLALDGPPTVLDPSGHDGGDPHTPGPAGLALVSTQLGMLLGIDAAGNERIHVMLDKLPGAGLLPTNLFVQVDLKPSPPVVVDATGRVAFVRGNGRAGVVSPEGRVDAVTLERCASPVAVLPAGDRRMLVACHDGGLWMYGE
jgi:PQQ-like domain